MIRIPVVVQPRSRRPGEIRLHGEGLKVSVGAAPEAGKANEELLRLLAREFGLKHDEVELAGGAASRSKWVLIPEEAWEAWKARASSGQG